MLNLLLLLFTLLFILINLDINAGIVISQLGAVVTSPESSVMDCQLEGQLSLFPVNLH